MIITYSYFDQYKQIGLEGLLGYFCQTEIIEPPYPLLMTLSESVEFGIGLSESVEYNIALSESGGGE